jgi:DNA-binding NarL/FixJ family response regulator
MPQMLCDILLYLTRQEPAVEVVERLDAGADVMSAAARVQPDVVMISAADPIAHRTTRELLLAHPRARILTVSADGRDAHLEQLVPHRIVLHDVSPQELLDVMLDRGRFRNRTCP